MRDLLLNVRLGVNVIYLAACISLVSPINYSGISSEHDVELEREIQTKFMTAWIEHYSTHSPRGPADTSRYDAKPIERNTGWGFSLVDSLSID